MTHLQFVSVKLSIFLVLGILIGEYSRLPPYLCLSISFITLIFLAYLCFIDGRRTSLLYPVLISTGMTSLGAASISLDRHQSYFQQLASEELVSFHHWELNIREVLKSTDYYHRFIAKVEFVDGQERSGLILCKLAVDSVHPELNVDQFLKVTGRADEIPGPLNPHQFNYRKYMYNQGVYQQLRLRPGNWKKIQKARPSLAGMAAELREEISESLEAHEFGPDELGIIKALLLGQRIDLSEEVFGNYRAAGAIHILAVSGLHIGIILMLLQFLLKPLDYFQHGRKFRLLLSVLSLWGFALLAGFSASVVRAVTMFSFIAYAFYLNRPGNSFNILALSMFFILLLINPLLLFQPGFQLSYIAVFSILLIFPKLQQLWKPRNFLLKKLWELFSVGLAAQLGVLPVSLFYFHQFPGLFFVSNMIIVPFLGLILSIGVLVIVLSMLGALPGLLVNFYNTMIASMNGIIAWVARQELFLLTDIYFDSTFLFLCYILLILIILAVNQPVPLRVKAILCTIIGLQLWNIGHLYHTKKQQGLSIIHQVGKTVLFYQEGQSLEVLTNNHEGLDYLIRNYKTGKRINSVCFDSIENSYIAGQKKLLILDKTNIVPDTVVKGSLLLLSNSVKINLERLLKQYQPELIIADGSNYNSHIERWRKSCKKYSIPFHSTAEKGAMKIEFH